MNTMSMSTKVLNLEKSQVFKVVIITLIFLVIFKQFIKSRIMSLIIYDKYTIKVKKCTLKLTMSELDTDSAQAKLIISIESVIIAQTNLLSVLVAVNANMGSATEPLTTAYANIKLTKYNLGVAIEKYRELYKNECDIRERLKHVKRAIVL